MKTIARDCRRNVAGTMGLLCAVCLLTAGCSDPMMKSGIAQPTSLPAKQNQPADQAASQASASRPDRDAVPAIAKDGVEEAGINGAGEKGAAAVQPVAELDPARPREFSREGAAGALRITFDDLDLMRLLKMDPVTSDCIERMPAWLRDLDGKTVRVRGFMKPSSVIEGIPQFLQVRSTDLCCFGPKGKVYHMIAVTLKNGVTTDYIELKPFDVEGKFRIEKIELDEGLIYLLYHIDEATIIRN